MRVLPGVTGIQFDIPSETFVVVMRPGSKPDRALATIEKLGYEPVLLDALPDVERPRPVTRLEAPTSAALRKALERARRRDVRLVVAFTGTFCPLCAEFERTTLMDVRVRDALENHSEFLQIDVGKDAKAVRDLGVGLVPDVWFFASDGRRLGRENRFLDTDAMLGVLMQYKNP